MGTKNLAKVNNVTIQLVDDKNQKLIPIRPICEALGINFKSQYDKLKSDDFLCSTVVLSTTLGSDEKGREMVCLPFEFVFGWLFTINPKNVKPDAQQVVAKYRIECYRALYRYFSEQNDFLEEKQQIVNQKIEEYENIRVDFKTAEKRLRVAKIDLFKAKDFTYEQWKDTKRQTAIDFANVVIEEENE
jgi:hypothetical protein